MAIIVKNINITPKSTEPVIDRSYEISVNEFGKVDVGKNGLDLGCQGDHNITKLEFNVNKLNCASKLANYNPVLVFSRENEDGAIVNISCPGTNNATISTFYIPEDVTEVAGKYSIVYTLRENVETGGNITNDITNNTVQGDIDEKEVFVSNIFTGTVRSSIYADLKKVIKVKQNGKEMDFSTSLLPQLVEKRTEQINTTAGIYKKKIALTWPEGKDEEITIEDDNASEKEHSLGNKYDVFMTYITIDHPFYHEQSTDDKDNEIFVIFVSNDKDGKDYAVITTAVIDNKTTLAAVWVPAEVTVSDREKWKVGFIGLKEDTSENGYFSVSYSPAADFIVNQNFLVRDPEQDRDDIDKQSAEVSLMTSDGELQATENNSVYTLTVYDARNTTYPLDMSGGDVKRRLERVDVLDNAITELNNEAPTPNSIQGKLSTAIDTHDKSTSAHSGLVRAAISDAEKYANYKGKNTVEGIVEVIRGEMESVHGVTSETVDKKIEAATESIHQYVKDSISNHNNAAEGIHDSLVTKINDTKTELNKEIKTVKDLIDDEKTGLKVRVAKLEGDFSTFDTTYVDNDELTARLSNEVFGFEPTDSTYGSYTIKKLKDESDTRLSDINADIALVNVAAEEARATANKANQTATNAYKAVTAIIQDKAEKTEVQLLNTKLDTEIAKNTREHEAINKKINDDLAAAKIEIDGKITQAVEDAKYNLGLVDNQLQGQIDTVKERIQNLGSNEATINNRLSAAETDISELNVKINGLDNIYATDAALESVKSDLQALETKESQDITNLTNTINALKGSDVAEDVTISSIDSKVNTVTSDLETYKGEVNSSIANINTSIGELTSADEQINTSLNSKLAKTTQIQSLGNVFNSEVEWEAFKASAEATTLYFVLEEE